MVIGIHTEPGRPKGVLNKDTRDFKQAVSNLLEHAAPKMVEWLDQIAQDNPSKALDHIAGFAEYVFPKLSRAENINKSIGIVQLVLGAQQMIEAEKLLAASGGAVIDQKQAKETLIEAVSTLPSQIVPITLESKEIDLPLPAPGVGDD